MRREFSEHFSRRLGARTHPRGGSLPSQVRDLILLGEQTNKQTDLATFHPLTFGLEIAFQRN